MLTHDITSGTNESSLNMTNVANIPGCKISFLAYQMYQMLETEYHIKRLFFYLLKLIIISFPESILSLS